MAPKSKDELTARLHMMRCMLGLVRNRVSKTYLMIEPVEPRSRAMAGMEGTNEPATSTACVDAIDVSVESLHWEAHGRTRDKASP